MNEEQQRELSGERTELAKQLPLMVPFSLQICVTECCNLHCEFCLHGTERAKDICFSTMSMETISKLVNDLKKENRKVKQILISGIGEPLIHNNIVQIVKEVHKISDKVGIITNGTLLNPKLTKELLEAGLDVLRISINGLTTDDYIKYTNTIIEPEKIQKNIKYFFEQARQRESQGKSKCLVYVKIMNYMVDTEEKEKLFLDRYSQICDLVNIENLNEVSPDVTYNKIADVDLNLTRRGTKREEVKICPRPFYEAVISAKGEVLACCHDFWLNPHASVMGDLREQQFLKIWNSKKFNDFRYRMLKFGAHGANATCRECAEWQPMVSESDILDQLAEKLMEKYEV